MFYESEKRTHSLQEEQGKELLLHSQAAYNTCTNRGMCTKESTDLIQRKVFVAMATEFSYSHTSYISI